MGIPYSKEINAAFDQVTPLVAQGFVVLEKTKNIAILLSVIQVCTVVLLALILLALLGLLVTMNPDLETERQELVTPVVRWLAAWAMERSETKKSLIGVASLVLALVCFGLWVRLFYLGAEQDVEAEAGDVDASGDGDGSAGGAKKGKDVDAAKKGETQQ